MFIVLPRGFTKRIINP